MTIPKYLMEAKICNRDTCAEVEQLNSLVNSCQEEIRRLKEKIKIKDGIHETTFKNLMKERKENQRLNNIIKFLKKYFKEHECYEETSLLEQLESEPYDENWNGWKELKESDK